MHMSIANLTTMSEQLMRKNIWCNGRHRALLGFKNNYRHLLPSKDNDKITLQRIKKELEQPINYDKTPFTSIVYFIGANDDDKDKEKEQSRKKSHEQDADTIKNWKEIGYSSERHASTCLLYLAAFNAKMSHATAPPKEGLRCTVQIVVKPEKGTELKCGYPTEHFAVVPHFPDDELCKVFIDMVNKCLHGFIKGNHKETHASDGITGWWIDYEEESKKIKGKDKKEKGRTKFWEAVLKSYNQQKQKHKEKDKSEKKHEYGTLSDLLINDFRLTKDSIYDLRCIVVAPGYSFRPHNDANNIVPKTAVTLHLNLFMTDDYYLGDIKTGANIKHLKPPRGKPGVPEVNLKNIKVDEEYIIPYQKRISECGVLLGYFGEKRCGYDKTKGILIFDKELIGREKIGINNFSAKPDDKVTDFAQRYGKQIRVKKSNPYQAKYLKKRKDAEAKAKAENNVDDRKRPAIDVKPDAVFSEEVKPDVVTSEQVDDKAVSM